MPAAAHKAPLNIAGALEDIGRVVHDTVELDALRRWEKFDDMFNAFKVIIKITAL